MNYLITCAGKGKRFFERTKAFKPLIKIHGKESIIWALESFNLNNNDHVFIIYNGYDCDLKKFLISKLNLFFTCKFTFLDIKVCTRGQLETAKIAIENLNLKQPILIFNNDTFFKCKINFEEYKGVDGLIPVFKNNQGDHFSFVKPMLGSQLICEEVTEKRRISNLCSIGAYYFSNPKIITKFFEEYKSYLKDNSKELYIAPFYDFLIKKNLLIKYILIDEEYKLFGTPKELCENLKIKWNELIGENASNGNHVGTLIVDIDDTICKVDKELDYEKRLPIKSVVEKLDFYHKKRFYIILNTSRNVRTFNGNKGLINKYTLPLILNWLNKYSVPYDEIHICKPWGNNPVYLDDKSMSLNEFIKKDIKLG